MAGSNQRWNVGNIQLWFSTLHCLATSFSWYERVWVLCFCLSLGWPCCMCFSYNFGLPLWLRVSRLKCVLIWKHPGCLMSDGSRLTVWSDLKNFCFYINKKYIEKREHNSFAKIIVVSFLMATCGPRSICLLCMIHKRILQYACFIIIL